MERGSGSSSGTGKHCGGGISGDAQRETRLEAPSFRAERKGDAATGTDFCIIAEFLLYLRNEARWEHQADTDARAGNSASADA